MQLTGEFRDDHYRSIYFHHHSRESDLALAHYLDGIAEAVNAFRQEQDVFPILVGMEMLDRYACERLVGRIEGGAPLFISDEYNMYDPVSVLRRCSMMVSSRYHAIVTSMPGLVPSAGITMDERIRNLMAERGHDDLFLEVDDEDLGERLVGVLRRLHNDAELIRGDIARVIPPYLERMGEMGIVLTDEVRRVYPELPIPDRARHWSTHLPRLDRNLEGLLEGRALQEAAE